jgi:hypothetical protein
MSAMRLQRSSKKVGQSVSRGTRRQAPKRLRAKLELERLEDRTLLSLSGLPFPVQPDGIQMQRESANASARLSGNSVVVWNDNSQIQAQVFDQIGNRVGGAIAVSSGSLPASEPAVAMGAFGDFVVTWTELEASGDEEVKAAQFHPDGTRIGSEITVAAAGGLLDHEAKVAIENVHGGNFVVSYTKEDRVPTARSHSEVWAANYLSGGTLINQLTVASAQGVNFSQGDVAYAPDATFFEVAFRSDHHNENAGIVDLGLNQFDPSGNLLHAAVFGFNGQDLPNSYPRLAINLRDDTLVSWETSIGGGLSVASYTVVHSDGTFVPHEFSATDGPLAAGLDIAVDPRNDNFVTAYQATSLDRNGNPLPPRLRVTEWLAANNYGAPVSHDFPLAATGELPSISVSGDHRFLVTYTVLDGSSASEGDIFGQFGQLGDVPGSPLFLSLATHVLTVTGNSSNSNTITISNAPNDFWDTTGVLVVTVNSQTYTLHWSDVSGGISLNGDQTPYTFNVENVSEGTPVTINTGAGNDVINVSPVANSLDSFNGSLTINGGGGNDSLVVNDSRGQTITGRIYDLQNDVLQIDGLPELISYSGLANVELDTAGSGFTNVIDVQRPVAGSTLKVIGGDANDILDVDFSAGNPIPPKGLTFDGGGGNNSLNLLADPYQYLTDTATGSAAGTLTFATNVISLNHPTISYANVQAINDMAAHDPNPLSPANYLTFNGPNPAHAITVSDGSLFNGVPTTQISSTLPGSNPPAPPTFATLSFANRVYATVNSTNPAGVAGIYVVDLAGAAPQLGSLTINTAPGISLGNYQSNQNVYVLATPAGVTTTINATNGWHDITVGMPTNPHLNTLGLPASPLDNIRGPVTVVGAAAQDVLTLWDWDSSTAVKSYDLDSSSITAIPASGPASAPISWQGVLSTVVLYGSFAADTYRLRGDQTNLAALVVYGGYTANTFVSLLPDRHTWGVYGNTTVTTAAPAGHSVIFGEVWNLTGGPAGDTFQFRPSYGVGGKLQGVLTGNGGTLDYSQYQGDITVDLALHLASRVNNGAPGGVFGIANVIGSQGNDLLVGDGSANILRGGTGRNLIIGGGGADQLYGGGGDNLLIAGLTSYDQNLVALDALFAEWTSTDSLTVRMKDISTGGGLNGNYVLNPLATATHPATVFADSAADQLFDGSGLSWFFVHQPGGTINQGAGPLINGDVVTLIP